MIPVEEALAMILREAVLLPTERIPLREAAGPLCEEVRIFDVFRSPSLGEGRKSLAFTLRFRAPDRTLTDEEVADVRARIVDALRAELGAEPRA